MKDKADGIDSVSRSSNEAERGLLPPLLELEHMRGDLHMHTRESDGRATLEEMAETARGHGYGYIAITQSGLMLPRTIFDQKVLEPQQPLFSGGADCRDGITQRRP